MTSSETATTLPASENIVASVVIPVRNGASSIGGQLDALANQRTEFPFEVIVVDDGSSDGTAELVSARIANDARFQLVRIPGGVGAYAARNRGVTAARGHLIAFCDADDEVDEGWLDAMIRALQDAPLAGGTLEIVGLSGASYYRLTGEMPMLLGFLPAAFTANFGVRRETFDEIGGMDPTLPSGGDADFCWRAQLAGFELRFAADAVVRYRVREDFVSRFRRFYAYGNAHPTLYKRFRAYGLERRPWGSIIRDVAGLARRGTTYPRLTRVEKLEWAGGVATIAGRLRGSLRERVLWL